MPRHKAGKLVQVRESALELKALHGAVNRAIVEEHGYLWFIERWMQEDDCYRCKSLSTGKPNIMFFADEIRGQQKKDIINA